ncbi:hypothetical protein P8452_64774 [Trifolium repens]|nr:hypothetical protein P8452_64768 [Trifolium repens]WJX81950.1 hypothetical protein P8452_64770 [Trifolium repens]WJX81952.1 hypothetical protein P8452_64772 [Trifolium repens]WJX81954.1 hypothetical protein P8452_64774 [Trifolium repens]
MPAKAVKSTAVVEGAVVTAVMKESFLPPPPERNRVSLLALKFIYTVILFVSLFIVVTVGQRKCNTDQECYKKYPNAKPGSMTCFGGICSSLIGGGPRGV